MVGGFILRIYNKLRKLITGHYDYVDFKEDLIRDQSYAYQFLHRDFYVFFYHINLFMFLKMFIVFF